MLVTLPAWTPDEHYGVGIYDHRNIIVHPWFPDGSRVDHLDNTEGRNDYMIWTSATQSEPLNVTVQERWSLPWHGNVIVCKFMQRNETAPTNVLSAEVPWINHMVKTYVVDITPRMREMNQER